MNYWYFALYRNMMYDINLSLYIYIYRNTLESVPGMILQSFQTNKSTWTVSVGLEQFLCIHVPVFQTIVSILMCWTCLDSIHWSAAFRGFFYTSKVCDKFVRLGSHASRLVQLDSPSWLPGGGPLSVPHVPRGPKCFCDADTGIGNCRYMCI